MSLVTTLRDQQLGALGETDIDALSPWLARKLMDDINAVGQEVYAKGPAQWWREVEKGDTLLAPVTLSSVTVTANSKALSAAGLTTRMHGATVQCSGQSTQNRIFQTGALTWEFLFPHTGTTAANATLTVYHDCLNLTDSVLRIIRPVLIRGVWELQPVESPADLQMAAWYRYPSHNDFLPRGYPVSGWDRQSATPTHYYVDSTQLYGGSYVPQIRVNPLPDAQYSLSWLQRDKFSKIESWNDTRTTIVPHEFNESVLIPLLLARLTRLGNFQGNVEETIRQATVATELLATLSEVQEQKDVVVDVSNQW